MHAMGSNDTVTLSVSRPKIHRPPSFLSEKKRRNSYQLPSLVRGVRLGLLLAVASLALFIASRMITTPNATVTVAATRLEPSAGDAMAMLPQAQIEQARRKGKTIMIEGKNGTIVGQLAKIPSENGGISEISTVSDVDNRAGRELLSIISKY
jgi:hypothetical protein